MNYTKGEWKASHPQDNQTGIVIYNNSQPAMLMHIKWGSTIDEPQQRAFAQLIVSAVNACISINPDNPLAVAESIPDMFEVFETAKPPYFYNIKKHADWKRVR